MSTIMELLVLLPIILVSISIHEFAHAKVADILGDPTPRMAGRLTLNPIKHIDPIGFLMLLLVRIGWAKPVPVNPYNFRHPRRDMAYVGLAGPASNFFFAWILAIFLRTFPYFDMFWVQVIQLTIWINLALMVFNLLPIPPLDGSRIFAPFIPEEFYENMQRYAFIILIAILLFGFPIIRALIFFFYNLLL